MNSRSGVPRSTAKSFSRRAVMVEGAVPYTNRGGESRIHRRVACAATTSDS